ncbi:MAG TPA: ATP-binding cassette domain-containing protein [Burkholderiales bacterium]|nr:ATP-binding cassette domain-containing protein [Burkholderiales bacterium]
MTDHEIATTLSARGLTRVFGPHAAVKDVDLELKRGEVLGFLGPNGAGKTTIMQMLTGNLAPTRGSIAVCGIDLLERPTAAKAKIGYLPEIPPLYRELTVDEYLVLAARLHRVERAALADAIARTKERCGLATSGRKLIGTLSKGYQQRVGIAQAIVHDPDVLILDEPTVGLDPNQIREIRALIRELGGAHSVILSTHILPEVEAVCDRVQILHHGSVVYNDTIRALETFERGRTLMLGLRRPPPPAEIVAIAGIVAVEPVNDTLYRVQLAANADPTEALVSRAVAADWGLYQLNPAQTSLEDVFVHLTRREEAPA